MASAFRSAWTGKGRQAWRARSDRLLPALPSPCMEGREVAAAHFDRSLVWLHTSSLVFKLLLALIFKVMFKYLFYFFFKFIIFFIYLILKIKT
jgi:hypothetical protein